jgi:tRNA pseudouridine13 synthase
MELSVGMVHSFHSENLDKTIKIKEKVEDFIVQEVINEKICTIQPILNLQKFKEAENLFNQPLDNQLSKEERKKLYEIANYHPFKRMYTKNGQLMIENKSEDIFVFTLLKYDYSDMAVQRLLSNRLGVSLSCIQTAGTKDKRGITLQEVSVKCNFEQLFNYAFALSKNPKLKFIEVGYQSNFDTINEEVIQIFKNVLETSIPESEDNIGIYDIRRGNCRKLGDLSGNYFVIKVRNFFDNFVIPEKFYNYFGMQRFGNNCSNHIIGELILNKDYDGVLDTILKEEERPNEKPSYIVKYIRSKLEAKNKPKYIVENLPRASLMLYLHAYQSYLYNLSINARIEMGKPNLEVDKIYKNNEMTGITEDSTLDTIYVPLKKMEHRFLKGGMRKMIEEIKNFEKITTEEGIILKFYLPKSCYATVALREIAGRVVENNIELQE